MDNIHDILFMAFLFVFLTDLPIDIQSNASTLWPGFSHILYKKLRIFLYQTGIHYLNIFSFMKIRSKWYNRRQFSNFINHFIDITFDFKIDRFLDYETSRQSLEYFSLLIIFYAFCDWISRNALKWNFSKMISLIIKYFNFFFY